MLTHVVIVTNPRWLKFDVGTSWMLESYITFTLLHFQKCLVEFLTCTSFDVAKLKPMRTMFQHLRYSSQLEEVSDSVEKSFKMYLQVFKAKRVPRWYQTKKNKFGV